MPTSKKERWTVTFRVDSKKIKDEINKFYKDLADQYPDKFTGKGQALYFYTKQGQELIEKLGDKPPSKTEQEVLDEVNCYYLKFEDSQFKCFEYFKRKKKPDLLGDETNKVLLRCETCRQGEVDEIRKQYQKKLRGQNIRGILQMIKQFQIFAKEGVPATIYFCNRIPGRQVMTGKKTMTCTKHESRVPIDTTCKDPRCQYFEEYTIKVESEFPQEALLLIEGIAEEYELLQDLKPKKKVEVEQVDKDDK